MLYSQPGQPSGGVSPQNQSFKVQNIDIQISSQSPDQNKIEVGFSVFQGRPRHSVIASGVSSEVTAEVIEAINNFDNVALGASLAFRERLAAFDIVRPVTRGKVLRTPGVEVTVSSRLMDELAHAVDYEIGQLGTLGLKRFYRLDEITPQIVCVHVASRALLCATFMRPQEHSENPEFKDRIFSRAEFAAGYSQTQSPVRQFSYYADWAGFNFPETKLTPLADGRFGARTAAEDVLVGLVRPYYERGPFYVIGSSGNLNNETSREIFEHEVRHGLWHTDPEYQKQALDIIQRPDIALLRPTFEEYFGGDGEYHPSVWTDEFQAHLGNSLKLLSQRINFNPDQLGPLDRAREAITELQQRRLAV